MQPVVRADESHFDRQTQAYAEFRLFSRSAVVTLSRPDTIGDDHTVCWITVVTSTGETLHVTASEPYPYAAIDRAVAGIASALRSRGGVRAGAARESA